MSTTITKRADELRRGDVITDFLRAASFLGNAVVVNSYSCGSVGVCDVAGNFTRIMLGYDTGVLVEAPALSPAQQHAEELLFWAREFREALRRPATLSHSDVAALDELLAKIDPPAPPTLEEALEVMQSYTQLSRAGQTHQEFIEIGHKIRDICDRARRAKIIP